MGRSEGIVEEMVKVSGLTVQYPGNTSPVLNNVDLSLRAGECVVVSGPSGCGKSTLALCLTGFVPHAIDAAVTGSVRVAGLDPARAGVYNLAEFVGLVQQDPEAQFCTTRVEDEVAFGPENLLCPAEEIARRVDFALDAAGASHLRMRRIAELSGGEKQRVALAAVLAMRPRVLVLDEPTAYLDPRGTGALVRLLGEMRSRLGLGIIILEHRVQRFLRIATRVVYLSQGTIVSDRPQRDPACSRGRPPAQLAAGCGGGLSAGLTAACGGAPLLQVRGLSHAYADRAVLRDVNLEIRRGEIVGLMGDNGSGKTTLLLAITGVVRPASGRIALDGEDITSLPVSARARRIGMIFQNPNHQVFTDRVWREVVAGPLTRGVPEAACRPTAEALLDRFGLLGFRDSHPLALSYGQKRRLNLAAIMINEPSVLLLDEPFVGQDATRAQDLMCLLGELASTGKGILLVGHDPDLMSRCCHRLLFLDEGRITVDAPVGRALADLERMDLHDYLPQTRA